MRFKVTLKTVHDKRPSGHTPSAGFVAGDMNYTEEFWCKHAKEHADFFFKVFDLSALKCGIDTGEFPSNPEVLSQINKIIEDVNALHKKVYPIPKRQGPGKHHFSLAEYTKRKNP